MGDVSQVPAWATGSIDGLVSYVQQHSSSADDAACTLALVEPAVPQWRKEPLRYAEHFGFLADCLYTQCGGTGDARLDRAVALWREASDIAGLSGLVAWRLRFLGINLDLDVARRAGGPATMGPRISAHCVKLQGELDGMVAPTLLGDLARNFDRISRAACGDRQLGAAADAGRLAARAAAHLFRAVPLEERAAVVARFRDVPLDAASVLLRAGRAQEAAVVIEAARQQLTHLWGDVLDFRRTLGPDHADLGEHYRAAMEAWRGAVAVQAQLQGAAAIEAGAKQLRALEERAKAAIVAIQQVPGLDWFQRTLGIAQIRQAADPFPLLYVWSSRTDTAFLLVLPDGGVLGRYVAALDAASLRKLLAPWMAAVRGVQQDPAQLVKYAPAVIRLLDSWFGTTLKEVLTARWRERSQGVAHDQDWVWGPVALVVSGPLSFVPVHAWTPYLADAKTGAPTSFMTLLQVPSARQALQTRRVPRPTGASRRLLSLADPAPRAEGLGALPCARLESTLLGQMAAEARLLHGEEATAPAFLGLAGKFEVLHLACHARAGRLGEGGARLELGGGPLTAQRILGELELDAALVVLSACRTAEQDPVLPEEALDLGSMFLAAGARGVIANQWPVDDLAAALFVCHVFELWNWGAGLPVHDAVHAARLWLRDATVAELHGLAQREARWSAPVQLRTLGMPGKQRPFEDPYHWAAFAYFGT
jgi:hypothetical protein